MHWTQTAKGKRLLAKRKRERERGKVTKEVAPEAEVHIAYLFGKVEVIIEHYAASAGVPRAALTNGVAELLQRAQGR